MLGNDDENTNKTVDQILRVDKEDIKLLGISIDEKENQRKHHHQMYIQQ